MNFYQIVLKVVNMQMLIKKIIFFLINLISGLVEEEGALAGF